MKKLLKPYLPGLQVFRMTIGNLDELFTEWTDAQKAQWEEINSIEDKIES